MHNNITRLAMALLIGAGTMVAAIGPATAAHADGPSDDLERKGTAILENVVEDVQGELVDTLRDLHPADLIKSLMN
jgi:hypothetical protein